MIYLNYLLSGGSGFSGSHLAEALVKKGHFVRILNTPSFHAKGIYNNYLSDYKNIEIVWGDIRNKRVIDHCMKDIETVFHLAAKINVDESITEPKKYIENNYFGTQNVLESVKDNNIPLIQTSSCEVYGGNLYGTLEILEAVRRHKTRMINISTTAIYGEGSQEKMDEWHPLCPASPYAASKAAADRLCCSYYKTHDLDIKIARPFNLFGPRQKRFGFGAVIPIFYEKALDCQPLCINGDGKQTRDYLYIDDMVEAYQIIADTKELKGKVVNVGSGMETSINQIAETVLYFTKKPYDLIQYMGERKGEVDSFICDNTLISKYGFEQKVSFEQGMKKYYKWRVKDKSKGKEEVVKSI